MPHDTFGNKLEKGDRVLIEAEVVEVFPTETGCNVQFKIISHQSRDEYHPTFTCNSKLVQKFVEGGA